MACQKWGAGNDPEAMGLAFHQESTSTDAHCQATTNLVDEDWLIQITLDQAATVSLSLSTDLCVNTFTHKSVDSESETALKHYQMPPQF